MNRFKVNIIGVCALFEQILMGVVQGWQMAHVEVSMNLSKAPEFMSEMASLPVKTNLLPIECATVLWLVLVVRVLLLLLQIQEVVVTKLIWSVSILTLVSEAAEAILSPILAKLSLVHGSLDKWFAGCALIRNAFMWCPSLLWRNKAWGSSSWLEWINFGATIALVNWEWVVGWLLMSQSEVIEVHLALVEVFDLGGGTLLTWGKRLVCLNLVCVQQSCLQICISIHTSDYCSHISAGFMIEMKMKSHFMLISGKHNFYEHNPWQFLSK